MPIAWGGGALWMRFKGWWVEKPLKVRNMWAFFSLSLTLCVCLSLFISYIICAFLYFYGNKKSAEIHTPLFPAFWFRLFQLYFGERTPCLSLAFVNKNIVVALFGPQNVTVESLYKNHTCVITFLRRFGWSFCRFGAKEISKLKPQLDANGIRLIGIGLEELGLEEFQRRHFFAGGKI